VLLKHLPGRVGVADEEVCPLLRNARKRTAWPGLRTESMGWVLQGGSEELLPVDPPRMPRKTELAWER